MNIAQELSWFLGQEVRAVLSQNTKRRDFSNQIQVCGNLEYLDERKQYRVLVDEDNYCYFTAQEVLGILPKALYEGYPSKNTIYLKIDAEEIALQGPAMYSAEIIMQMLGLDKQMIQYLRGTIHLNWEKR